MTDKSLNRALVAFGSNLGDREVTLSDALVALEHLSEAPLRCSSWWGSTPILMADDAGEFINGVVEIQTSLSAWQLLIALQGIEQQAGRPMVHGFNASRVLDLDIICYGEAIIDSPDLVIPHPRAAQRLFVLMPLAELCPGLVMPGQLDSIDTLINRVSGEPLTLLRAAPVQRPRPPL
ncbi:MAG: 2-amino-4-hydroxy-6-hydroxymethyldihydropteridine diphosphokinase [Cyclobacteriaceae bacterium]|jgi:2-amino-4-hydroxy-6-hydroxymethyldihydropteridine diphosphokinase